MGRYEYEKLTLLPLSSNSSNSTINPSSASSSSADGDDNSDHEHEDSAVEFKQNKTKQFRKKIAGAIRTTSATLTANNRRKLHINRGLGKRLTRLLLCAFMIPMLLFLTFYSTIFSGASSRHYPLSDWDFSVSRNISDYVLPLNDTTLLEPRHKCHEKMFILIVVCSGLNNFVARQTIRETWGNTTEFNYSMFEKLHSHLSDKYLQPKRQRIELFQEFFKLNGNQTTAIPPATMPVRILFLLGHTKIDTAGGMGGSGGDNETHIRLQQEAEQYDDIIQENFLDTYNNLTIKSVMALKWITRNKCFQKAAFFMKCDDDTFVNVPNLLQFLLGGTVPLYNETLDYYDSRTYQTLSAINRLNATTNYMVGYMFCKAPVLANVKSKWYMPYYMYSKDYYPTYLSGSGYLMSMDVVPRLYEASLNTSLVYLEDVYVTGMCAEKANIQRHHHPLFNYGRYKHSCTLKGMITLHKLTNDDMYAAYNFVTNVTYHCPPPGKYFKRIRLRRLSGCG
ncbi:lactosylceramide 1,3-N-acetyl-beta-D-glucosaminyltransferase-like [Lucilia sericata]|uniref:lactosylceramide 1,3-N-acetyl-beta-D-glucosaminyltransferase-like n=1 Tax=Lucilia sericata TaxID=13632 RepID=UPI0018A8018A|nr:lactosylceramide 1,3-N-acetyl-beta-D-glucosaminyltransferase-like [Lucilia sericata]